MLVHLKMISQRSFRIVSSLVENLSGFDHRHLQVTHFSIEIHRIQRTDHGGLVVEVLHRGLTNHRTFESEKVCENISDFTSKPITGHAKAIVTIFLRAFRENCIIFLMLGYTLA